MSPFLSTIPRGEAKASTDNHTGGTLKTNSHDSETALRKTENL